MSDFINDLAPFFIRHRLIGEKAMENRSPASRAKSGPAKTGAEPDALDGRFPANCTEMTPEQAEESLLHISDRIRNQGQSAIRSHCHLNPRHVRELLTD